MKKKDEKKNVAIKSPAGLGCAAHSFFDLLSRDQHAHDGMEVWFFCNNCLMTVKKILTDNSNNF